MVITALIIMNMKIMETDLHDAQLRHLLMEYQIMDPSPDSQGTILKEKMISCNKFLLKSSRSCLSPGDRVYDNYSMLKEISGNYGNAEGAEKYAIHYCKDRYKNECDIIVKIVRNDAYEGSFFNTIFQNCQFLN